MNTKLVALLVAIGIVIPSFSVYASWQGYDPQTNEWPDSSWTLSNSNDPIASVASGIANITTTNSTGRYEKSTGFDSATGFTVDIRVKELQNDSDKAGVGFRIIANNDDGDGWAFICKFHGRANGDNSKGRVSIAWSDGPNDFSSVYDENDDWHVFRIAAQGENVKIYIDDQTTPIYDATVTHADRGAGLVSFGDWGSSVIGDAQLDYILYDDTQAIFAPPIPEPTTIGLIALGILGIMRKRQ